MTGGRFAAVLAVLLASAEGGLAVGPPAVRRDRYGDELPRGAIARLGSTRLRHMNVRALSLSADGAQVASLGMNLRLWDRASGRLLREFEHGRLGSSALTFTPDGKHLLASRDDDVMIWDLASGQRRALWRGGKRGALVPRLAQVTFSQDGKTLAIYREGQSLDKAGSRIDLLDFPSGAPRWHIAVNGPGLSKMCSGPRGRLVFDAGEELQVWDTARRRLVKRVNAGGFVYSLALSLDGTMAAAHVCLKDKVDVKLINLESGRVVGTGIKGDLLGSALAFTGDGKQALFATSDGAIVALDVKTGKQSRVVAPRGDLWTEHLTLSADGRWLAQAENGQAICVLDVRTGKPSLTYDDHRDGSPVEAVPSPDGRWVATRSYGELRIWGLESGRLLRRIAGQDYAPGLRWSADGKEVAIGRPGTFAWYAVDTGRLARKIALPDGRGMLGAARLVAGGRRVVATTTESGSFEGTTHLLDAADGKELARFPPGKAERLFDYSDDGGHTLWSADMKGEPWALSVKETPHHRLIWKGELDDVRDQARLFPTGRLILATRGKVETWEVVRGRRAGPAYTAPAGGRAGLLAVSADGRTVALELPQWVVDPLTGETRSVPPHEPSGLCLLEVASGRLRARLPRLPTVTGAHFTRDGRRLITTGEDGTALVWDLAALADREVTARTWDDLASSDARVGFAAVCGLAKSPRQAVALLAERLPAGRIDAQQVRRWIDDLDSDTYALRQSAERRLAALGEQVEEDLHAALKQQPPLERRQRLARLLKRLEAGDPETLRCGRALEVLERVRTGEAVRLLQRLAQGHPGSRATREAREALARLRAMWP